MTDPSAVRNREYVTRGAPESGVAMAPPGAARCERAVRPAEPLVLAGLADVLVRAAAAVPGAGDPLHAAVAMHTAVRQAPDSTAAARGVRILIRTACSTMMKPS